MPNEYKELSDFFRHIYEVCPDLKSDGLKEFDGYFTSYDNFLERISAAWGGEIPCYDNDPFELIMILIEERDEALALLKSLYPKKVNEDGHAVGVIICPACGADCHKINCGLCGYISSAA